MLVMAVVIYLFFIFPGLKNKVAHSLAKFALVLHLITNSSIIVLVSLILLIAIW